MTPSRWQRMVEGKATDRFPHGENCMLRKDVVWLLRAEHQAVRRKVKDLLKHEIDSPFVSDKSVGAIETCETILDWLERRAR